MATPPRGWWRIVAMTYEWDGAQWIPVVRHELYGPTYERAIEVYQAHMQSDRFLNACSTGGAFGDVRCRTETHAEQL